MANKASNTAVKKSDLAISIAQALGVKAEEKNEMRKSLDTAQANLEKVCTAREIEIVEEITAVCLDKTLSDDGYRIKFADLCAELCPKGAISHKKYKPIVAAIRQHAGDNAAVMFRTAVRAMKGMRGMLPSAGKGTGTGIKGLTAAKWAQGESRRINDLVEHIGKAPMVNINAKLLGEYKAAVKALLAVERKLVKSINE